MIQERLPIAAYVAASGYTIPNSVYIAMAEFGNKCTTSCYYLQVLATSSAKYDSQLLAISEQFYILTNDFGGLFSQMFGHQRKPQQSFA